LIGKFPLAHDTSGAIAEYVQVYESNQAAMLDLGVAAFGVEAKLSANVSISTKTILSLELAGGHSYELHGLTEGQGMTWTVT
jgi:hypothetical protein